MPVEWDPAPPTTKQRIVAAVLVVLMVLTSANLFFEWRLFHGYDKPAMGASFLIALVVFDRFMPGVRDV